MHEQASERQRVWSEVDGENWEVDSRDKVRNTESSDQLYVTRMVLVVKRVTRDEEPVLRGG